MYLSYWELREKPFENTPDPRFFFQSRQHREALIRLLYTVYEAKGAALVTGEYGCGKTTLIRTLINEIDPKKYHVVLLNNPRWSAEDLLREILYQLGAGELPERKRDVLSQINDRLYQVVQEGRHTVVIVDEAQVIDDLETFDELRMLLNFQFNDRFMLSLIFSGQPELRPKMREMPQLTQRIAVKYHLVPLHAEETERYIDYRLALAGSMRNLFDQGATDLVYEFTKGVPRTINNLCDLALALAAGNRLEAIDTTVIQNIIDSETAGGAFSW